MFPINCPLAFNREINGMKKLNSKYVESVVKKAVDGKIVAVHKEKTLEHGPNREKAGDEGHKKRLEDQHGSQGQISRRKSIVISNKKYHGNK